MFESLRKHSLTIIFFLFGVFILVQAWLRRPEAPDIKGQKAPDFTLTDLHAKQLNLSNLRGKNVVLVFWASWCGPCQYELPKLETYYKSLLQDQRSDVIIIGVNTGESEETVKSTVHKRQISFPVVIDRDHRVSSAFRVSGIPQTVLIDPAGTIVDVFVGYHPTLIKKIERQVRPIES